VELRHGTTRYEVVVENPDEVCGGVVALAVDGEPVSLATGDVASVAMRDDGRTHRVEVRLGHGAHG
jgi:cyclic beta-1,2-glucan synthetase